jgi:chaperonin GroES
MNIIPLGDRILVQRERPQTVGREATALADALPDASARGVVVAAGAGRCGHDGKDIPLDIKAGDTIVFAVDGAREVTVGGLQYWIMQADDVLIVEIRAAPLWTRRR